MKKFLVSAIVAMATAVPASASLIVNGDFEVAPTAAGNRGANFADMPTSGRNWDTWANIPGWTGGTSGIEIQTDRTLGVIDAQSNDYYVELDSDANSSMMQDVYLAVGDYLLSFWYSPRTNNPGTNGIDYSVGSLFSETVTGPDASYPRGEWTLVEELFSVTTAGTYSVLFEASGTSNRRGGLLDNVSLTAVDGNTAPVPLPAGGLLLLAGLGGLGLARRKTR